MPDGYDGEPHDIQYVSIRRVDGSGALDPANPHPHGKVPFLKDNASTVFEQTAIALGSKANVSIAASESRDRLVAEIDGWQVQRNQSGARITWMFSTDKARTKMARAYPNPSLKES